MSNEYTIVIKKDGDFYIGSCMEINWANGQGNTREEAIEDTKKAIKLCLKVLEDEKKEIAEQVVRVSL